MATGKPMDSTLLEEAVNALQCGKLVAFPTETVYGLGADASNPDAIERLYQVKGRPRNHPVIVHLGDVSQLSHWAVEIPPMAYRLAEAFWPGPLTLILKRAPHVLNAVTGGQETVGIRIPNHPLTLELLNAFGGGVVAPSANRFGRLSPTSAAHVQVDLGEDVEVILDGGPCQVGVESTIVDLSGERPHLLRPGMITPEQLQTVLGIEILSGPHTPEHAEDTRAPGTLKSHYAPRTPVRLISEESLLAVLAQHVTAAKSVAVLARHSLPTPPQPQVTWKVAPSEPEAYTQQLYQNLRELDQAGASLILVQSVPAEGLWHAVHDRLQRAAYSEGEAYGS